VKKSLAFYQTKIFKTMIARTPHWRLSWVILNAIHAFTPRDFKIKGKVVSVLCGGVEV
jgi:hypothetical protein